MPTVLVRDLSVETHRALKQRAARSGKSTQAEIRVILDEAVREEPEVGFGTQLRNIAMQYGGWDLELERRKDLSEPVIFE
jgi:plasmid stability protein